MDRGSGEAGSSTASASNSSDAAKPPGPQWGNAPDINYVTFDGRSARLSDHMGTPLVVNFWAAWCPPCIKEMPEFNAVFQEHGGAFDLVAIAVDKQNNPMAFFDSQAFAFTGAFGDRGILQYVTSGIPVTAFIDRDGNLVYKQTGQMTLKDFRKHLGKIL